MSLNWPEEFHFLIETSHEEQNTESNASCDRNQCKKKGTSNIEPVIQRFLDIKDQLNFFLIIIYCKIK